MNKQEAHEMVGMLLDALNKATDERRTVSRIVMLGDAYAALRDDLSAKQFLKPAGQGWEFNGIPVWSAAAEGEASFRIEYA